ncbi:uncharacterized protein METZ01_LOCUS133691, partial [marine metagenome]
VALAPYIVRRAPQSGGPYVSRSYGGPEISLKTIL